MLSELDKCIAMDEPILFTAWRPHTMFTEYDVKMLEDPKEVFRLNDICIGTNPSVKDEAPDVISFYRILKSQ